MTSKNGDGGQVNNAAIAGVKKKHVQGHVPLKRQTHGQHEAEFPEESAGG
ncbi:hypothetical protein AMTR_s00002p00271950 [Amborella trichopoda]|uniref:Uncharacterized protein n=1 Tax=Amborella trichopoda TaxID=13333 RepID=W1P1Q9_AMBTC|nr:hypothetical protein AMTR_s00002p00271950 [Amborella trichopoda]